MKNIGKDKKTVGGGEKAKLGHCHRKWENKITRKATN